MRPLLALLLALVPLSAFGANPTLTSFENPDFIVDTNSPPASPTNVIRVNLRSSQFSHDANGITLTNVGSSIGTGTSNTIPVWTGSNTLGNSVFFNLNPNTWAGGTNFYFGFADGSFSIVKKTGASSTQFRIDDYSNFPDTALTEMTANSFNMQPRTNRNYSFDVTKTTAGQGVVFQFANANPILTLSSNENVIVGNTSADPTRSTNYFYIPMSDGVPTGIPNNESGRPALVYDTNNSVLYSYNAGSWHAISGGSGGIGNVINTGPSVVNMVPVYTDTSGTQVTPTNSISVSTLNVGTISYTNPPVLPSYAVANLPVSSAGAMAWATDILTPIQSDKTVYYDGSNWRLTRSAIKATADLPTFLRNCLEVGWEGKTPSNWGMMMDFFPINMAGYLDARFYAGNSGTGSGVTSLSYYTPEDPCGSGLSAGTTTTGFCYMKGGNIYPIAGFGTILSAHIALNSGLPDGTDNYWVYIGFDTTAAGGVLGANSSGVYYDPYNALGYGATLTNNWQFVNRSNSVGTIVDTGHTADANWTDFTNVRTGTSNIVYINGTAALTNLTYTQTAYQAPVLQITKTLGTNARYFAVDWVYWAYHFNTARSFR